MHPDTLRRQLRQGRIRSVRTGKLWRIPESVLTAPGGTENPAASAPQPDPRALQGAEELNLAALFAPPTPEQIAARLEAWKSFGRDTPRRDTPRRDTPLGLSDEADPYGYDERAAQLMEGHR